ncbi:ABC-F family ATP-binding cassette domain-containing protein [Legionella londiniensis]|uniref:Probable ATP-binding protein YheS n=1 Tax=Legionella londiniensis TaxID=45068 RepID=A0A0W0VP22_9GAMM|nr:ATP-binding cassette domain-containing protein [Legionella londiniensis]KTD21922.1 ABC transporter ATP binding protein [Legionella londiniensis]STX92595.1 ABC transporter ATP binding protein [Legionella londiniensis]
MLTLNQITLSRGNKILLNKASACLYEKQKVGLVGQNGCGKSSLFALLRKELAVDAGEFFVNPHLRISHLAQQVPEGEESALDYVLAGDEEYIDLQRKLKAAEHAGDDMEVLACHTLLNETEGYSKPAKAAAILAGLGFAASAHESSVNSFSGGWRMRLNLARCLMKPADLLLLDEPTNHLDMEAIIWLEKWLKHCPQTIILISHDREFLDAVVTHILHIEQQGLFLYSGNYSDFERSRAEKLALQQALYNKQQNQIKHLMSYVERFRAKATKARQAQSRLKAIARMDIIAQAQIDSSFSFQFYPCGPAAKPLLKCQKISVGYKPFNPVLQKVDFTVNPSSRIALLGPNGQGKSTLIKALVGDLEPLAGDIERSRHLRIGYYAQHQLEQLDVDLSPLETIQPLSPDAKEQTIRDFLGGFNFAGDMATSSIRYFSGGEKARLALAKLVWLKPNLLLLDEPTNHLDLNMRAAIEIALQSYEGALILISHDRHLLRTAVDDFYLVNDGQVTPFSGDLEDYYQWMQGRNAQNEVSSAEGGTRYREKRSLQNRLKKLEALIDSCQKQLTAFEEELGNAALYAEGEDTTLQNILRQRLEIEKELAAAEEAWLEVMEALETF